MGRGLTRATLLDVEHALDDYQMALSLKPDDPELLNNIGLANVESLKIDEAISVYEKALCKAPGAAHIYSNLGIAYAMNRKHELAIQSYEKAIKLDPLGLGAEWNRSLALLALGDYKAGWLAYEIRNRRKSGPRVFDQPLWLGDFDISTKTILLHAEQGLGDTLQFCRYADLVATQCKCVILKVPQPLVSICSTLVSKPIVISDDQALPAFDVHCPLMSLPFSMKTAVETIPNKVPYLFADPIKADAWSSRFSDSSELKIGIVWSGGFHADRPSVWGVNARRDIPFEFLEKLEITGVQWICLQKGKGLKELESNRYVHDWRGPEILNISADLHDFSDTAAVIANLDLVISVDTAVAHLAGALGKPVWILNRFDSCWRWFVDRADSPYYPTAVIYNQPILGDWNSVILNVYQDLEFLVSNLNNSANQDYRFVQQTSNLGSTA